MSSNNIFATDDELLERFRNGDNSAFDAVMDRYSNRLFTQLRRLLSPEDAEETMQQAFLELIEGIRSGALKEIAKLDALLATMAWCRAKDRLRSQTKEQQEREAQSAGRADYDGTTPYEVFLAAERSKHIEAAIARLEEPTRRTVELVLLEGRSWREAGRLTGTSENTVKQRIRRARKLLMNVLGPDWKGAEHELR